jgi:hypothetical protein
MRLSLLALLCMALTLAGCGGGSSGSKEVGSAIDTTGAGDLSDMSVDEQAVVETGLLALSLALEGLHEDFQCSTVPGSSMFGPFVAAEGDDDDVVSHTWDIKSDLGADGDDDLQVAGSYLIKGDGGYVFARNVLRFLTANGFSIFAPFDLLTEAPHPTELEATIGADGSFTVQNEVDLSSPGYAHEKVSFDAFVVSWDEGAVSVCIDGYIRNDHAWNDGDGTVGTRLDLRMTVSLGASEFTLDIEGEIVNGEEPVNELFVMVDGEVYGGFDSAVMAALAGIIGDLAYEIYESALIHAGGEMVGPADA